MSRYDGNQFTTFTTEDGLGGSAVWSVLQDRQGNLWFGTGRSGVSEGASRFDTTGWSGAQGGVSRYDGNQFTTFTTEDGLASNAVWSMLEDQEGNLWFGTEGGSLSRYGGDQVEIFTTEKGLAHNSVNCVLQDRQGNLWFGTQGGVSRYDGASFATFTTEDGLASDQVVCMLEDRQGNLWFGTERIGAGGGVWRSGTGGGVSRYDGEQFTTFTTEDGLASDQVVCMLEDRQGNLWFGTLRGGASRFDGVEFTTFTTEDGLAHNWVWSILEDRQGNLWFGTGRSGIGGGVSRYDGTNFTTFTTRDGLASNQVRCSMEDQQGNLWFGTQSGGVSRYDGNEFVTFTTEDDLAHNWVSTMLEDRQGNLWFGTQGGGVSRYDGLVFQRLGRRDGLTNDLVEGILQDRQGDIWIATRGGVTRFRPYSISPPVHLTNVMTNRDHGPVKEISLPTSQTYIAFEFGGRNFKTHPDQMAYIYRLQGRDAEWQQTRKRRVAYTDLPRGDYEFEIKAVDRDLSYSQTPATVRVHVHLSYERIGWIALLGIAALLAVWQTGRVVYRDRRLQETNAKLSEANQDLQEANQQIQEANQHKSDFLARMSHELRTPMNAILGYAQILRDEPDLPPRQQRGIQTIARSGEHLLALINDVLDLARIEAGRLELNEVDFDLSRLVRELAAMFELRCAQKGLAWRVEMERGSSWVRGDENKLRQVLINLLGNAVKFTDRGEVVLQVDTAAHDRYRFAVHDTGPGISPERQTLIFQPFEQEGEGVRKGGTGLGLAIAQRHVILMGGTLELESSEGQGACFAFTLHLSPASAESPVRQRETDPLVRHLAPGFSVQALVVDDVPENREVLGYVLEQIGVQVQLAGSGEEGLVQARQSLPDIVFMDIHLPGIDGVQTMQRIWDEHGQEQVKIAAISASVLRHERQQYLEAGFDAFLGKPFRREQIYACLAELLGVEFAYESHPAKTGETLPIQPEIVLPEPLYARLWEAADLSQVTAFERGLEEVQALGVAGRQLAVRLSELNQQYDRDALLALLEGISHE